MRDLHISGRSNVLAQNGMIATSHPLSSSEGISILKKGGNAIDAAIAASAVQAVVEPNSTGIGGDCFALISLKGKKPISVNGSGIAARNYNIDFFEKNQIKSIENTSAHSVTIPGSIHAWYSMHKKFGHLNFEELFITAENYARYGYPVHEVVANSWIENLNKLKKYPSTNSVFLKNGRPYSYGQIHKNLNLANTLKSIAENGIKDFYEGYIAEDIVNTLNEIGGLHSIEDFECQDTIFTDSLSNDYKDITIHQCPPNGPGITVLIMMAILEKFNFQNLSPLSTERFHLQAEASKIAYEQREIEIGDPNFNTFDFKKLIDPEFINHLSSKISMNNIYKPKNHSITAHPNTIYLTVVDKDQNAVSFINSICFAFGSGITSNKTGILLQNRGVNFRLKRGHPNMIEGHKRPLHTIIPGMISNKDNEAILSYGVMGGQYQPVGHTNVLQNIFDFGLSIQESIDFPRAFMLENIYKFEKSFPLKILNDLKKIGHIVEYSKNTHGGGQAIFIDKKTGTLIGGSDSRKDGCAIGY
ncbi:gamma-glutamyltransferase [Alphaproteobacteria bacterium]|nr:gamma-glutamyltransferase [Alphaproteobacteria bacterium]